jgi:hypothetical protein
MIAFAILGKHFKRYLTAFTYCSVIAIGSSFTPPSHAANKPSLDWRSLLNMKVYESGYLGLDPMNLIFAPAPPLNAQAVVKNAAGKTVTTWKFFPNYGKTNQVFAYIKPENHSDHTFPTGDYIIDFMVGGELATQFPFSVKTKSNSNDPFNPGSKLSFIGPWQELALFTFQPYRKHNRESITVHFWAGSSDLDDGNIRGALRAELTRNGTLIAHNMKAIPTLGHEWITRQKFTLFEPHKANSPNALPLAKSTIEQDGNYQLTIKTEEDGKVIRSYKFTSSNGKLNPLPRTVMGYQPHSDYIAPRIQKPGSSNYEFIEAFWISK